MLFYQSTLSKKFGLRADVSLYLMRTVFLSDISMDCSSEAVSALLMVDSSRASFSFKAAAVAELSEAEAAHRLTEVESCRPPMRDRFWTVVLRRLSSPSISFLRRINRGEGS